MAEYPAGAPLVPSLTGTEVFDVDTGGSGLPRAKVSQIADYYASNRLAPDLTALSNNPGVNAVITDPNNASFSNAVQLVAGTDYSAQKFRAVNVNATTSGSCNFTLINGTVLPQNIAASPSSYQLPLIIKSVDAIPAGITLFGLN